MILHRSEAIFLFLGDIAVFYLSLFLMLLIRYGLPFEQPVALLHFLPFSILFVLWVGVFFIAGLYEQHTLLFQKQLPYRLVRSIGANALLAVFLFYFFPAFLITPRINLFLYLIVSSALLFVWRLYGLALFGKREKQSALLIGSGAELRELEAELSGNLRYGVRLVSSVDVSRHTGTVGAEEALRRVSSENVSLIIIDLRQSALEPILPRLYAFLFSRVRFIDLYKVYEEIFGRIPLSLVNYPWFLGNISASASRSSYDFLKRCMDIAVALVLWIFSLFLYPFVSAAIKYDDGGPLFVFQERIGQHNRSIRTRKFRTMTRDDAGRVMLQQGNRVTRVGAFLRRTRIDETPQLWNVLRGEMSLIGPRPELPSLVAVYEREVPYYRIRHLIKPGLSGWAQIYHENHPHHAADVSETKVKLSYDLYYIKNRSLWLDVKIALKTIKILLSRSGV